MDGTTDVIKAFDIRDNLFERTLTANVLRHRPNGVPTDGSLNDGRTVIGIGLEGQPQDARTHGEREGSESACNHASA